MRYLTLQALTWTTVAIAVISAVWLAAAGGQPFGVGSSRDSGERATCGPPACTVMAARAATAKAPASSRTR